MKSESEIGKTSYGGVQMVQCRKPRHGMGMRSTEFQKECIFASVSKNDV